MADYDDSFYDEEYLNERQRRREARAAYSQAAPANSRGAVPMKSATPRPRSHMRPDAQPPKKSNAARNVILIVLGVLLVALLIFAATRLVSCKGSNSGQEQSGGNGSGSAVVSEPGSSSAATPAQQQAVTINVLMVGDMLVHHGVWESGELADGTRNFDHLFAHTLDEIQWADIAMIDQETPLAGGTNFDFTGFPTFNGPQEIGDAEVKAGFNVILHATNHSMDQGYDGMTKELTFWRNNHPEVQVAGEVMPYSERASEAGPTYFEKDGFKVAIITSTYDLNGYTDPEGAVNITNYDQMAKDVALAEQNADLTIYCPHWGDEGETYPNSEQISIAKYLVDLGVDVIIGNHPHIIQPVSLVVGDTGHTAPVYWSTGNFISTMDTDENLIGGAAKLVLVKDVQGARVAEATFVPHVAHRAITVSSYGINDESDEPSYNADMTTYLLSDYTDEIAATNAWRPDDSRPSHDWCVAFCSDVLGSGFDPTTCVFTLNLDPASAWNLGGGSSSSSSSSTTSTAAPEAAEVTYDEAA